MQAVLARRDADNHTRTDRPRGRAPTSRTARPALPGSRGPVHRAHRPAARPGARDRQGLLLRPRRRQGQSRQAPLPGCVPRLRRTHPAAQRQARPPTSTARPATPEQSQPNGQPSQCATQCAPGNTATAACPPHTTGHAPTPAAAALKRSSDSMMATGRPPASSATCSAPGRRRARPPAPRYEPRQPSPAATDPDPPRGRASSCSTLGYVLASTAVIWSVMAPAAGRSRAARTRTRRPCGSLTDTRSPSRVPDRA